MGKVYLVGAGPGDPGLLTCKGRDVLATADCVLYDHLANDALLSLAPQASEKIYVGKKKAEHALEQDEICALLVERAKRGWNVVRLKGGDPFLFGRGGEEAEALAQAGLDFEVIPGVTSPLGIAAYTGVPLTHREHTSVVTFVTGHKVDAIDWTKVGTAETLVIFMGLAHIGEIAAEIIRQGRSPQTPAMAVRWGTRPWQRTVTGTLEDIAARIESAKMKPPATVIVGEVVRLRDTLNWYEKLPLFGQKIVVTRAPEQAADFAARLSALGADAIELPAISLVPVEDASRINAAIANLSSYDWVIFTSVHGARFFLGHLDASSWDLRQLRARLCAIGPATRRELEKLHLKVDLTPESFVAESLADAFAGIDLRGRGVLIPRAESAREVLPERLRAMGAEVDVVPVYRNVVPEAAARRASEIFSSGEKPNWITFTSSSTVTNFLSVANRSFLDGVKIASIGPITSSTLRENGLPVDAEAREYTSDGLLEALLAVC